MSDDKRNILDKYKNDLFTKWTTELVREDVKSRAFPFAVLMEQFVGDFTIGSTLRSCNFLGGSKMFYYGNKKWDRRSSVGTHHYTDMIHIATEEEFLALKKDYVFIGLENNIPQSEPIFDFVWPKNALIILGEEGVGITKRTLELCDKFVYIPDYGSVRSLNASVAGSIAMYDYVKKMKK